MGFYASTSQPKAKGKIEAIDAVPNSAVSHATNLLFRTSLMTPISNSE